MTDDNSWDQWRNYVLKKLEESNNDFKELGNKLENNHNSTYDKLNQISQEITKLKVKSGVWGGIAGFIPIGLILAYSLLRKLGIPI